MGQVLANKLSTPLATISGGSGGDAPGWMCYLLLAIPVLANMPSTPLATISGGCPGGMCYHHQSYLLCHPPTLSRPSQVLANMLSTPLATISGGCPGGIWYHQSYLLCSPTPTLSPPLPPTLPPSHSPQVLANMLSTPLATISGGCPGGMWYHQSYLLCSPTLPPFHSPTLPLPSQVLANMLSQGGREGTPLGAGQYALHAASHHLRGVLANMLSTPLATISGGSGGDAPGWPFVCFDLNPNRVRMGKRLGFPVLYGDGCRPAVLESAGIPRPLMAIVVYSGRQQSVSSVERLHDAFPGLPIYARAVDASHLAELRKAGATDVVLESAEPRKAGATDVVLESAEVRPAGGPCIRKAGGTDVVLESAEVSETCGTCRGYSELGKAGGTDVVLESAEVSETCGTCRGYSELGKAGATDVVLESAEVSETCGTCRGYSEVGLRLGSMLLQDMGVMRDDVVFLRRLMREALDTEALSSSLALLSRPPTPQAGLRLGSMLLQDMGVMRDDVVFLRRLMREALDTEAVTRRTGGQRLLKDRSDLGGSWPPKEENLGGKRAAKEDLGGSGVGKEGGGGRGEESDREGDSSGNEEGGGGKVRVGEDGEKEGKRSDGLITRAQAMNAAVGFVSGDDENGDAGNNGDDAGEGDGDGDGDDDGGDTGETGAATPAEGSGVLITRAQALSAAAAFVTSDDDNGDAATGNNGDDLDDTGGDGVLEAMKEHLEEGKTSGIESSGSGKTVVGSLTGGADMKDGNSGLARANGSGEGESDSEGSGSDGVGGESSFSTSDDGLQYFSDGEDFVDTKLGCNSSSGTPREL
ncbi:unnamed protein product [Closterium sp. Naga37s-1]|nr:unnamed protein product [Closterium sp. Naga37s-1]